MKTTSEIVERYAQIETAGDRYALKTFSGGNSEMCTFLNNMPGNWRLHSVVLADNLGSPTALFEITPKASNGSGNASVKPALAKSAR